MTEWEQIKKEYREIPVPADGPHQVLQTIVEAKHSRNRNRFKKFAQYGTVAAAVLLVVLLVPGMLLFSGGFSTANDCAPEETGCAVESIDSDRGLYKQNSAEGIMMEMASAADSTKTTESIYDGAGIPEQIEETGVIWAESKEAISLEIRNQMEKQMLENGEIYFIKSEEYPEGFELVSEEQEYYINEDGLLVIVFEAGSVAPKEKGKTEFIIPAEVFSP